METLRYTIIKTEDQYMKYCNTLEQLCSEEPSSVDEIDLLTLLIEKWDEEHILERDLNPIELLQSLMIDHELKAKDICEILDLSKGTVSKILNYQKGLSKEVIRKLSSHFKLSQEAFNRHYELAINVGSQLPNARIMNTTKEMADIPF